MSLTIIALMQLHILSTIIALTLIFVSFIYAICTNSTKRFEIIKKCIISAIITLIFTINIWATYLILNFQNKLLTPYPYTNPLSNVIKWGDGSGNLYLSIAIECILIAAVVSFITYRKELDNNYKFLGWTGICYLSLSSGVFFWNDLFRYFPILNILQFPFRLAPIGILILIYILLFLLQKKKTYSKLLTNLLLIMTVLSAMNTFTTFSNALSRWNTSAKPFGAVGYLTYRGHGNYDVQDSFNNSDLSSPWKILNKPIPDYLPESEESQELYKINSSNRSNSNLYYLLKNVENTYLDNNMFTKSVKDGYINLKWYQSKNGYINIPIVRYKGTHYMLNNKELGDNKIKNGKMGSTKIYCKKGNNELKVNYIFNIK